MVVVVVVVAAAAVVVVVVGVVVVVVVVVVVAAVVVTPHHQALITVLTLLNYNVVYDWLNIGSAKMRQNGSRFGTLWDEAPYRQASYDINPH